MTLSTATPSARHAGRVAIVTGAAQGVGRAIAQRLATEGASIALWDVSGDKAQKLAASLPTASHVQVLDITDEAAVEAAAGATFARFGRVDLVVNNAGVLGPVAPTWEHEPAAFRRVLDVNLTGTFLVCRAVVPRLLAQAGPVRGRLVNMASIQGKEGMPQAAAYAASKAGVMALTKTLGKELARSGILVNCITPSAVEATGMAAELAPERRAEILARIPMGRFVELDEVAAMVAWLGSDACSFSTGAVFDLSGGRATY
jgi:NAD(P)-dependent dehydrogenase (short-subunit alcohol dehydrogenase family)